MDHELVCLRFFKGDQKIMSSASSPTASSAPQAADCNATPLIVSLKAVTRTLCIQFQRTFVINLRLLTNTLRKLFHLLVPQKNAGRKKDIKDRQQLHTSTVQLSEGKTKLNGKKILYLGTWVDSFRNSTTTFRGKKLVSASLGKKKTEGCLVITISRLVV
jgi:hypothetical protein